MIKNYFFNIGYQILVVGLSLILAPYLTRTVGAEGIGIYSYTYSIAMMFGIVTSLGIGKYGVREIAKCSDDRKKRSEVFSEILFIKLLCGGSVLVLYNLFIGFGAQGYETAFKCQIFLILSYIFDMTWVYWGMQEFRFITLSCGAAKLMTVVLIVLFVRSPADTDLYIFLTAFSFFAAQFIPCLFLKRYVDIKVCAKHALKKHGKSIVLLFFPVLAKRIYMIMDMVMLGHFTDMEQVGYYQIVEGIEITVVYILTALSEVIMPQITLYIERKKPERAQEVFRYSFHLISFLAVGFMYGLIGIAEAFIPFFYGRDFAVCAPYLMLFAPVALFSGYAELIRSSFLLPYYRDRQYVTALAAGAVVNFCGNLFLIRPLGVPGAILASGAAELTALLAQVYFSRKELPLYDCLKRGGVYLLLGMVIPFLCNMIGRTGMQEELLADILIGGSAYTVLAVLYLKKKEPEIYTYALSYLKKWKGRRS